MIQLLMSMFGGDQGEVKTFKKYTGPAVFSPVAVNFTKEEYKAITGKDYHLKCEYGQQKAAWDETQTIAPVVFLMYDELNDNYETMSFNVSDKIYTSKEGKKRFISSKGHMTFPVNSLNDITTWDNEVVRNMYPTTKEGITWREMHVGEYDLYNFMQTLIRLQTDSDEANWLEDTIRAKLTVNDIYNGNSKGLKDFVDYCNLINDKKKTINEVILLYTIKEKLDDDGETKKFYQKLATSADSIRKIGGEFDASYVAGKLKASHEKSTAKGYTGLTKDLFTYTLQEFKYEDCINAEVDANAAGEAPVSWG